MEIYNILSQYRFKPANYAYMSDMIRTIEHHGECVYCGREGYLKQIPFEDGQMYTYQYRGYKFRCEYCRNEFEVGDDWVEVPNFDDIMKAREKPKPEIGPLDRIAAKIQLEHILGKPISLVKPREKYVPVVLDMEYLNNNPKLNTVKAMKILGTKSLDKGELKIKYRESLKLFHPDRNHYISNKEASYYINLIQNSYKYLLSISNVYYNNE